MHFVLMLCVVIAFSSSSNCPVFFSFFTRLFTAFSHHFSSWPFCSPFFQPKSLLTMGGVKGKIDILSSVKSVQCRGIRWFGQINKNNFVHDAPNNGAARVITLNMKYCSLKSAHEHLWVKHLKRTRRPDSS